MEEEEEEDSCNTYHFLPKICKEYTFSFCTTTNFKKNIIELRDTLRHKSIAKLNLCDATNELLYKF